MSHQTFQDMWAECVQELMEQVQIEYLPVDAAEQGHAYDTGFEHNSLLYIKYMQIYQKLEMCYDQMVHPQKRRDIRKILETVIVRILELKEELIKWNRRPDNHIVPLDEVLTDLKLNPETVDWQVPRYFTDDQDLADELEVKQKRIKHWLHAHGMPLEEDPAKWDDLMDKKDPFAVDLSIEQAIRIIQKNERGRIGIQRAQMVSDWRRDAMRKEERNKKAAEKPEHEDPFDQQVLAATMIAAHWKRRVDRKRFQRMREEEFQFLGMAAPPPPAPEIDQVKLLAGIRGKRKKMQQDAEDEFARALQEAEKWVREKRGPDMMAQRKLYCREWILRKRKQSHPAKLPNDLTELYAEEKGEGAEPVVEEPAKADPKAKAAPKEDENVQKTGATESVTEILRHINEYTTMWEGRPRERANFEERVDLELARAAVLPKVEAEIRQQVDTLITEELQNLIKIYEKAQKKGKKEKKGGKKGKKGKDKKPKVKKWCAAVGMITNRDICVPDLIKECILKLHKPAYFNEFLGEFAYMGQVQRVQEPYAVAPSAQMIKSLLIEHCVLPLASLHVRQRVSGGNDGLTPQTPSMTARSLLIYGPRGTGKSMLARAIATEAGAMFFDISPHVIDGLYTQGKAGGDLLVYKVLCVAQDLSPSVIYLDNVEKVFIAGKKGKKGAVDPSNPNRIKKVLVAAIKQVKRGAESTKEDRVLFIGVTHGGETYPPFEGVNTKELYEAFDFRVWCSFPDCGSRVLLIRKFIEDKDVMVDPAKLNISSLSIAADGYSAGSLKQTVDRVLTKRRIQQLKNRPLQVQEFLGPLSRTHFSWPEEWVAFREFDHEASGEKARIEEMQNKLQKLEGADDKGKKK